MPKTYPAVLMVANHGRRIALAGGVIVALLSLVIALTGAGAPALAAGLVAAVVLWAGLRLLAELVEVVAETLLPR